MELTNTTGLPAGFLVGSTSDDEQLGMVASKVTYRLTERGGLVPLDADQMWPVHGEPVNVGSIALLPELDYRKEGVDIIVLGNAVAPQRRAIPRMTVRVECGAVNYPVEVFGDRQWKKSWGRLFISDPLLFEEMPLTNDRAFGGRALMLGEEVSHPVNPDGRGFCLSKEEVEWKLLPNLERPDELITSWQKPVTPACMLRPKGPLMDATGPGSMAALAASPDPAALSLALQRRMFSQTVPGLVCPGGKLGRTLQLSGFDAAGDIVFPLPAERAIPGKSGPTVHVSVGALRSRFPLSISTIVALVPQRVLVVTWLGLFRYFFRPEEMRSAELRWSGDKSVPPPAAEPNRREVASLFTQ